MSMGQGTAHRFEFVSGRGVRDRSMFVSITSELISDVSGLPPRDFPLLQSLDLHLKEGPSSDTDESGLMPNRTQQYPKIRKIEKLTLVPNLVQLNLSYNAIQKIENLDVLTKLVELNLAENGIAVIENLDRLQSLQRLNLSGNIIERIPPSIIRLKNLTHLRLARNKISQLNDIANLSGNAQLTNLRLDDNPVSATKNFELFSIFHIPSLTFLDGQEISARKRQQSRSMFAADMAQTLRHRIATEQQRLTRLHREIENELGVPIDQLQDDHLASKSLSIKLQEVEEVDRQLTALQGRLRDISAMDLSSTQQSKITPRSAARSVLRSSVQSLAMSTDEEYESQRLVQSQRSKSTQQPQPQTEQEALVLQQRADRLASKLLQSEKEKEQLVMELNEMRKHRDDRNQLKAEIDELEQDLEQALAAAQSANAEIESLSMANHTLTATNEEQQKDIERLTSELRKLSIDSSGIRSSPFRDNTDTANSRLRMLNFQNESEELTRQSHRLQRDLDECRRQANSLNDSLQFARDEIDRSRVKISLLEQQIIEKDDAVIAAERNMRAYEVQKAQAQDELVAIKRERDAVQKRLTAVELDCQSLLKAKQVSAHQVQSKSLLLTPQRLPVKLSNSVGEKPSSRSSRYLDVDSTDSEDGHSPQRETRSGLESSERAVENSDTSPRKTHVREPIPFQATQLERSAAEIIAHILLEELLESAHGSSSNVVLSRDSMALRESAIRAAIRLVHTSTAVLEEHKTDSDKDRVDVPMTPFHLLGDCNFLSSLVSEANQGLARLEDALQIKDELVHLEKLQRELESKISSLQREAQEKSAAARMIEKHKEDAKRQAESTLADLESLHQKLQSGRDELVKTDAEHALVLRELEISKQSLKDHAALSELENKSVEKARERFAAMKHESSLAERELLTLRETQSKEEVRLRSIKQTISEEIRALQNDVNKLHSDLRSKHLLIDEYEKQKKLREEESELRKREIDSYLVAKTREVEDETRRLNSIRNETRVVQLEIDTAKSRRHALEHEIAQLNERLQIESTKWTNEQREAQRRIEISEKQLAKLAVEVREQRELHTQLSAENQQLSQSQQDLQRSHTEAVQAVERQRAILSEEQSSAQLQLQQTARQLRSIQQQREQQQHEAELRSTEWRAAERKLDEARRSLRELTAQRDQFQSDVQIAAQEREKCGRSLTGLRSEEEELRQNVFQLRKQCEYEQRSFEEARRKCERMQNEEAMLQQSEQKIKTSLQALKRQTDEQIVVFELLQQNVDRERRQLTEMAAQRALYESELSSLHSEVQSRKEAQQYEREQESKLNAQRSIIAEDMQRATEQRIVCAQQLDALKRRESEARLSEQQAQTRFSQLQRDCESLTLAADSERVTVERLREQSATLAQQISQQQHELQRMDQQVQERRVECESLRVAANHAEKLKVGWENDAVRRESESKQEARRCERLEQAVAAKEAQLRELKVQSTAAEQDVESQRLRALEESRRADIARRDCELQDAELRRLQSSIAQAQVQLESEKRKAVDEIGKLDVAKRSAQAHVLMAAEAHKRVAAPSSSVPVRSRSPSIPGGVIAPIHQRNSSIPHHTTRSQFTRQSSPSAHSNSFSQFQPRHTANAVLSDDDSENSSANASFQITSLQKAVDNLRSQSQQALQSNGFPIQ